MSTPSLVNLTFAEETYIIEEGTYYLAIGTDAHDALNNILSGQGKSVTHRVMGSDGSSQNSGDEFVHSLELEEDFRTYSRSAQTGEEVFNQLDSGDINKYENRGQNSVVYLSRSNWQSTYPKQAAKLSLNMKMARDLDYDKEPIDDGYEMPVYGKFTSQSTNGKPDITKGDMVAYQFMNAPLYPEKAKDKNEVYNKEDGFTYGDWEAMWDRLLDQMTADEQAYIIVNSYHWIHGAESVYLPESRQENGPVGITRRMDTSDDPIWTSLPNDKTMKGSDGTSWVWVAYPCAGIIAASFNNEVAKDIGEHKSEDMLYTGYNGIYGPGVNIHRSPYGGRAFEYPSEDPFLAGMIEAYECMGIESKGCLAYAKHYALNDMETNRVNLGVWSNEQASREIYLRAFEIVFTVGKASATMNSFTRIGMVWSGASYAMMTTILRDEWGYDGLVISDWDTDGSAMSKIDGVLAGTDTFDGNKLQGELLKYKDNAAVAQAMRTAVKRVIYNVVRTHAMNGMSLNSRIVKVTPWWQTALIALQSSLGVLFAGSVGMLVASFIIGRKSKDEVN